ncbi:MAG: hypothetical protein AB7N54_12365 [Alphaproteobacteria bacterium]
MTRILTLTAASALAAALALPALAGEVAKKSEEAYGCAWGESPAATASAEPTAADEAQARMIATLDKWLEDMKTQPAAVAATPAPATRPGS